MTQEPELLNWRKRASEQLNDEDVEVAFMRQGFVHIEGKARPLLREPFFIGFEIVDKNDANTNMVGLFVFRVDRTLLYAPLFFKNGDIKGGNLLYDSRLKLFSPLVAEWCNYHVGRDSSQEGSMLSAGNNNIRGRGIDFDNIRVPETLRKSASEEAKTAWHDMQKEAAKAPKLLPKLLKSEKGTEAFAKIAHVINQDFGFACAMNECYEPEEWLEAELGFEKSAAITEPETLQIHIGEFNPNTNVSVDTQFVYGASATDTRSNKAEVYEDREELGEQIQETGVYKVIDNAGAWKDMLVIVNAKSIGLSCCEPRCEGDSGYYGDVYKNPLSTNDLAEAGYDLNPRKHRNTGQNVFVFDLNEKKGTRLWDATLFGNNTDDKSIEDATVEISKVKTGDHIQLIDGCYVTREPVKVTGKKEDDGILMLTVENVYGSESTVKVNMSVDKHKADLNVWSKNTRAFKTAAPEKTEWDTSRKDYAYLDFKPGNFETIADFLCGHSVKRASISKIAGRQRYVIQCSGQKTHELNKYAAAAILAAGVGIDGNDAIELIKEAEENGERRFLVKAAKIMLDQPIPEKLMTMDSEFGVMQDEPESYTISTTSDGPKPVENKTGDQYTMDGMQIMLETGTPDELYQASQSIQDDTLFDIGVVGSLVKTFDGAELVEQFIPDLRQGLDKLGRILFLIHWKPENFVEAYGSDDVGDLENKIISSFKQFGDLVLDLMQQFKFEDKVDMNALGNN